VSRKVITILFIIGSCLYIPGIVLMIQGYMVLFQTSTQMAYSTSVTTNFSNGLGAFTSFLMGGALMVIVGGVVLLVARIGALMELGKAQDWVWFVLMIIFGWIVLLVYLIAVPKPKPAPQYVASPYPYTVSGQPWLDYPPPVQPWPAYQPPAEQQNAPHTS
jgi:hypothetical protein